MFSLNISRLLDGGAQSPPATPMPSPRRRLTANSELQQEPSWPEIDRRAEDNRRSDDRREQQQSIMLETRKIQGRRRSAGRRKTDRNDRATYVSISVKG